MSAHCATIEAESTAFIFCEPVGVHLDGKNTPGSYSALIVFEPDEPFFGSYYMLPQYHMGLDVRQGQCRL